MTLRAKWKIADLRARKDQVLALLESVWMSDRDRELITACLSEPSNNYKAMAKRYGIGPERVRQIIDGAMYRLAEKGRVDTAKDCDPIDPSLLDSIDFTVRTSNCLRNAGLKTRQDVVDLWEAEGAAGFKIPNFGRKSMREVMDVLGLIERAKPTRPVTRAEYDAAMRIVSAFRQQQADT